MSDLDVPGMITGACCPSEVAAADADGDARLSLEEAETYVFDGDVELATD
jgi:hypothetical protein